MSITFSKVYTKGIVEVGSESPSRSVPFSSLRASLYEALPCKDMDDTGVIWTVASVLTGAILAIASFVDGWQRWACFMVSFLPMFVATLIWTPVSSSSILRVVVAGTVGAIFGALLLVGTTQLLHDRIKAQSTPSQESKMPNNNPPLPQLPTGSGNFSIGQQGGSIHQTYINQVATKLAFTDTLGAELLNKISKDKPLTIIAVGSQSEQAVGRQISQFLNANGYKTTLKSVGIMAPPPDHSLTLDEFPSGRRLTVAPAVR